MFVRSLPPSESRQRAHVQERCHIIAVEQLVEIWLSHQPCNLGRHIQCEILKGERGNNPRVFHQLTQCACQSIISDQGFHSGRWYKAGYKLKLYFLRLKDRGGGERQLGRKVEEASSRSVGAMFGLACMQDSWDRAPVQVQAISVVRCSLSVAIMDRREVLVWALAWMVINAVVLVMISLSLTTLSISAFLLVRYRRGDEPPDTVLPMACWYILGTSLASLLCWTVAPFVRVLRKIRWLVWIVMFGLWFGAAFLASTGMGWTTEDNDSYCKMVRLTEEGTHRAAIIWQASEVCCCRRPYDEKPFGFGAWGERRRRRVRRMDLEERVIVEPEPVPLLRNAIIPHPTTDAGPPEVDVKAPEGAGCIPGPPEPVHVSTPPIDRSRSGGTGSSTAMPVTYPLNARIARNASRSRFKV
ncbi:hypothetical protein BKA70DRAFT_1239623 [Coprinopsis sp. MPI-PUGE-AT-0042]|nr:hypothetical protein BKA70DRAFT_1239623 [Coprinopsis sp. MPI-PUGE-AT-0042]